MPRRGCGGLLVPTPQGSRSHHPRPPYPLPTPRISRGDKDNLFVLLRESRLRETADEVWAGWRSSW
jgi:hypothetical protein